MAPKQIGLLPRFSPVAIGCANQESGLAHALVAPTAQQDGKVF